MKKIIILVLFIAETGFCSEQVISIGSGTTSWSYPFHTFNYDSRCQSLYYSSEINTAGYITGISFNLLSSPPSPITNFKIRLKHTSLLSCNTSVFDSEGWTVVYSGSWPAGSGWVKVNFDYPFYYNGNSNLLVDVSFDRSVWFNSSSSCQATDTGINRSLYASSDSSVYDPQIWNLGGYGPSSSASTKVPNIQLYINSKTHWQSLGIMCFNVRYANNTESDPCDNYTDVPPGCVPRRDRILEMVRNASQSFGTEGPDIIGMQEVYDRRNQIFDMVNGLDYKYSWSGISDNGLMTVDDGNSYNCIFYKKQRFNCKSQGTFWLTSTPDVPSIYPGASHYRIASWVILHDILTNRDYFVLNTHLDDVSGAARQYAAQVIMDKLLLLAGDMPIIIMGDMNSYETENPYKVYTGQIYQDDIILRDFLREIYPVQQPPERTFHSFDGTVNGSRVDFIFGRGDFVCRGATIERGKVYERWPSDHYPVTVNLYVPTRLLADLNEDLQVDMKDLGVFCQDWLLNGQLLTNATVDNNMIARWSFDLPVSGLGFADGIINGAVTFDGIEDAIYSSTNYSGGSKYSQQLNNWTITFWVRLDRQPYETSAGYYMMSIIGDENKNAGSIQIAIRSNNKLRLEVYSTNGGGLETAYNDSPLVTNKWYHAAVVYSKSPNQVKYYINGNYECTRTLTNQVLCWIGPLYIGKYADSRFLDGTLDEFRIYNRQLSDDEIAYLAAGAAEPGSIMQHISTPANFVDEQESQSIVNFRDFVEFIWNYQ